MLFSGGVVSVYVPKAGQVTEYNAGKNKADFETFLVLGFGGRGHDLAKSFDVKYGGMEQVQGINAAKLELTPKSQKVAQHVSDDHACGLIWRAASACSSFSTSLPATTGWPSTTTSSSTRRSPTTSSS